MIKIKVLSARAEKKMSRSILDLSRGGVKEKVKAAALRLELARARNYRDCREPPRKAAGARPRGATADVLLTLKKNAVIDAAQFTAAEQIAELWEAMVRGRDLQAADIEPRIRAEGPYCGPLEKLPKSLDRLRSEVWVPWADQMGKLFILNERGGSVRGGVSYLTVAIDIAAYRIPLANLVLSLGCNRMMGTAFLKTVFIEACDAWISAQNARRGG